MKSIVIKYVYGSSNKLYKGEMKMSREELVGMKLEALKGMAKELGLKGLSRASKQGLVDAIYEATKEADPEVAQLDLTDKEKQVVVAISQDDFYDGEGSVLWLDVFVSGAVTEGLSEKAIGGILTSLQNKGIVTVQIAKPKKDSTIALTENGEKVLSELLLEITDTIPDTPEVKAPKRAILKTFTGMVIGKVKEDGTPFTYDLVEQGGLYRLTKLDGKVLEFDKATLKQVNAKNPKFANKIELV